MKTIAVTIKMPRNIRGLMPHVIKETGVYLLMAVRSLIFHKLICVVC